VFHCSVIGVSRSRGRSAAGVAAYIAASVAHDPRDPDRVLDYSRKTPPVAVGYVHTEHRSAADFALALDSAEKRKNSQCAREVVVGLPASAPAEVRQQVAEQIAADMAARWDVPVMWAVHRPDRGGDQRNHHVHFVAGTRDSAGRKVRRLDVQDTARVEVEWLRSQVAARCQAVVPEAERPAWDHRSFVRRGLLDAIATRHEGPMVTGIRRTEARKARREGRAPRPVGLTNAIFNDELRRLAAERAEIDAQLYANIRDEGNRSAERSERVLEREREAAGAAASRLRAAAARGPEARGAGESGAGRSEGGGESSEGIAGRIRDQLEAFDAETRRAALRRRKSLARSAERSRNRDTVGDAQDKRPAAEVGQPGGNAGAGARDPRRTGAGDQVADYLRRLQARADAEAAASWRPAPAQPAEDDEEAAAARRIEEARKRMAERTRSNPLPAAPQPRRNAADLFAPGKRHGTPPTDEHGHGIPGRGR